MTLRWNMRGSHVDRRLINHLLPLCDSGMVRLGAISAAKEDLHIPQRDRKEIPKLAILVVDEHPTKLVGR
jgi:hypothetical protein